MSRKTQIILAIDGPDATAADHRLLTDICRLLSIPDDSTRVAALNSRVQVHAYAADVVLPSTDDLDALRAENEHLRRQLHGLCYDTCKADPTQARGKHGDDQW